MNKQKKKNIRSVIISIIACLVSLSIIIFGAFTPITPAEIIGISAVAAALLAVTQATLLGFASTGFERYYVVIIFIVGYILNFFADIFIISFYLQTLSEMVVTAVISAAMQLICFYIAIILARIIEIVMKK